MLKIVPLGGWDFAVSPTSLIKISSRGLVGVDRRDFFEKRAAANVFADILDKMAFKDDELPIHAIAIGATEGFGANRNGDAFNEKICEARHHTFVSKPLPLVKAGEHGGARLYIEHRNKDPHKSYGYVKAAAYNPTMRRIELLIAANMKKSAADRNGGLVLPLEHREKLAAGKFAGFSMACKLPYDECVICLNKAAHRGEYCDENSCLSSDGFRGFGCRTGLTKVAENGRMQYVENPNCTFFDFSLVGRPADRNAYGGKADYLLKSASDSHVIGGAELAEKYAQYHSASNSSPIMAKALELLHKLAQYEQQLEENASSTDIISSLAFSPDLQNDPADMSKLGPLGSDKLASALRAMADRKVMPTPADFIAMHHIDAPATKVAECVEAVAGHLPGVYQRLATSSEVQAALANSGLDKISCVTPSREQRQFAEKLAATRSVRSDELRERAVRSSLCNNAPGLSYDYLHQVKQASETKNADGPAERLARQYALLKLAMLCQLSETNDLPLTLQAVVLQNYSR